MASYKIDLNPAGIEKMMQSPGVVRVCRRQAMDIRARAGGKGFVVGRRWLTSRFQHGQRYAISVRTGTRAARIAEATDKVLSRAVR
ncbi:hypothetical protein HLV35_07520 [Eggerthellaceae bacterium zg-997]|nr:hypothetical protein [Eggerthellaceae bacterium zg-997]